MTQVAQVFDKQAETIKTVHSMLNEVTERKQMISDLEFEIRDIQRRLVTKLIEAKMYDALKVDEGFIRKSHRLTK